MPTILHLETATEVCSVCISKDKTILALKENKEGYTHASGITLQIQDCLQEAQLRFSDLKAVSLSQGPGSYTSLRVGTSAAKAICYAWEIPLITVDTLRCLALAAVQKEQLKALAYSIPLIDARRMEVYTAIFDEQNNEIAQTHAKIIKEGSFLSLVGPDNSLLFCGNGLEKCKQHLQHPQMFFTDITCSALHLVQPALQSFIKGKFADTAYFSPYYFKTPTITASKKKIL